MHGDSRPVIDVLLATYRAEPNMLADQIRSIDAQRDVVVNLISREDVNGVGACANFSALLEKSTARYTAFADQDDVWNEDKLVKSLEKLKELEHVYGEDTPLLVFTDAKVVDADLHELDDSLFSRTKIDPKRIKPRQLILQNVANGNTMLINESLRRLAAPIPKEAVMHDHWVMLVASVFGRIAYIPSAMLLYRQHGGNVFGGAKVDLNYYYRRIMQGINVMRCRLYHNFRQAEAFALRYPDSPDCVKACIGFERRNWFVRRWLLMRHRIFKNGFIRNLGTLLLV